MQLKRKNRPELPTFDEFLKEIQVDATSEQSTSFEITIESSESISAFFEDPFVHYSNKSDALDEIKVYDPYYPNFMA